MEIYKTTNKITGDFYIGLNTTSNPEYLGSGVEIKKQVIRYGKENFTKEILCLITSSNIDKNILRKIEHIYISSYISDSKCLNKCLGYQKNKGKLIIKTIEKTKVVEKIKYIDKKNNKELKLPPKTGHDETDKKIMKWAKDTIDLTHFGDMMEEYFTYN